MDNHKAAQAALWMIRDTLNAAASQAARASDLFPGTELCIAFHNLAVALTNGAESDGPMRAIRVAIDGAENRITTRFIRSARGCYYRATNREGLILATADTEAECLAKARKQIEILAELGKPGDR
jgi:hypothetical protein